MSMIEIGDKVKMSDKALNTFTTQIFRDFMAKHVYLVVDKEVSIWQGIRYHLKGGTYLDQDDCIKVDKDTPLFT